MLSIYLHSLVCEITGCPASGIDAVRWRRQHGVPEDPSNRITLSIAGLRCPAIESHADLLNGQADFNLTQGHKPESDLPYPLPISAVVAVAVGQLTGPIDPASPALLVVLDAVATAARARRADFAAAQTAAAQADAELLAADSAAVLAAGETLFHPVAAGDWAAELHIDGDVRGHTYDKSWRNAGPWVAVVPPAGRQRPAGAAKWRLDARAQDVLRQAYKEAERRTAALRAAIPAARAAIVAALGTDGQRERHAAGVLPERELLDLVRGAVFAAVESWPRFERLTASDLEDCDGEAKYDDDPATELDAAAWAQLKRLRAALAGCAEIAGHPVTVEVEARLHTATCKHDAEQRAERLAAHVAVRVPAADLLVTRVLALGTEVDAAAR